MLPKGLYAITGEEYMNGRSTLEVVEELLKSGVRIIQYREKEKDYETRKEECKELNALIHSYGGYFIVNDDLEIALEVGSDAVHLGQTDTELIEAKKRSKGTIDIGITAHTLDEAKKAIEGGADYLGVGPVYPTMVKPDLVQEDGLGFLEEVIRLGCPVVAIGGINAENIDAVVEKKPHAIAIIRALIGAEDLRERSELLLKKVESL
ncbi:thiamine phosphate synthase [Guggenheimella bovis]